MRDGARGGRGIVTGGARGFLQDNGGHIVCYVVSNRADTEASSTIITGMASACHHATLA